MDDVGVGRLIMLARQRKHWRQSDLAAAAGLSRSLVALAETGALEKLTLRSLRRIAAPLEIRLQLTPFLNGGDMDRLRDRDHARLVESVVAIIRRSGWDVVVEYTFNHYGERGSIDIVGWHAESATLLVIEVKSRIYDVQALIAGMDRKARVTPMLLSAERGWTATTVARLVVVPERAAVRRLVAQHASSLEASLPARSREVRAWLKEPSGALAGLWFLSSANQIGGIQVQVGRQRVRRPRDARSVPQLHSNANTVGE